MFLERLSPVNNRGTAPTNGNPPLFISPVYVRGASTKTLSATTWSPSQRAEWGQIRVTRSNPTVGQEAAFKRDKAGQWGTFFKFVKSRFALEKNAILPQINCSKRAWLKANICRCWAGLDCPEVRSPMEQVLICLK